MVPSRGRSRVGSRSMSSTEAGHGGPAASPDGTASPDPGGKAAFDLETQKGECKCEGSGCAHSVGRH